MNVFQLSNNYHNFNSKKFLILTKSKNSRIRNLIMIKNKETTFTVIDLFCGVGGFSLGAARAGFNVAHAIDNDPIVIETHKKNFLSTKHNSINLSDVTGKQLLKMLGITTGEITGIIGGPPCQGFSTIGKNHAEDKRNDLFIKFYQIVRDIKPKFFVGENVPGLLREKHNPARLRANKILNKDYDLFPPIIINAGDYGVPTSRTRVFFVGFRKSAERKIALIDILPEKINIKTTVSQALKGLPIKIKHDGPSYENGLRKVKYLSNGSFTSRLREIIPNVGNPLVIKNLLKNNLVTGCQGTLHSDAVLKRWEELAQGETDKVSRAMRLDPKGLCPTLRAGTGKEHGGFQSLRPIHPTENRVITPREAARLQGFPDWFLFHSTKWHSFRQIGNSVSPIVAELLLTKIIGTLKNT